MAIFAVAVLQVIIVYSSTRQQANALFNEYLQQLSHLLVLKAALPFALLTLLLMLVVWWVIHHSLAPIERVRRQLGSRAADDFSVLNTDDLPDEVRPLVDELNLLFGRSRSAFDVQKNFVAYAAHELRSPLTALKLQAQALHRQASPESEPTVREAGVARLNQGIDRAIRLVEQLLTLAREEASALRLPATHELVDLQEVIKLAIGDVLPQAMHKQIDLGVAENQTLQAVVMTGQREALRMLLRNLLDNAVKYTPPSGRIDVCLGVVDGQAVLAVEDSGPGIAPEVCPHVFDRFFQIDNAALEHGSGLGLAIVKTIADRHGATLQLSQSVQLGGLRVEMRVPVAGQPVQTAS